LTIRGEQQRQVGRTNHSARSAWCRSRVQQLVGQTSRARRDVRVSADSRVCSRPMGSSLEGRRN
jgi:hypothetical protein